ncbi:MAG: helix-turn-helix domain-containing protein [Muribaculaceae bacterium]|nr:helix-turn-helix domain-containing protein [Muribaculaceae bacterium]
MSDDSESTIITRLKEFIAYTGLSNSQFADSAGIPRPTISQLLHGRNKSINDLFIRKLHEQFPNLNIVWLLFGKGGMLIDPNIEFSEPQNVGKYDPNEGFGNDSHGISVDEEGEYSDEFTDVKENSEAYPDNSARKTAERSAETTNLTDASERMPPSSAASPSAGLFMGMPSASGGATKKIASIIVLYTDNSFETFYPNRQE